MLDDLFADCTEGAAINDKKVLARRIVDSIGARLTAASELAYSEIIRTVSLSSPEEYRKGRKNTFFIFSDMIENSPFLPGRKFFSEPDGAIIEKLAEQRLIPELWEAEVRVFGIGRTGNPDGRNALTEDQRQKIVGFWTKYFAASGASVSMHQNLVAD